MTFPWSDGSDIAFMPDPVDAPGNEPLGDASARDLTDDEVNSVLNGDYSPLGLTAAAAPTEHTGAMIALLPTEEDMTRLVVPGGEEDEELHLTLIYLGEAAKIPPVTRERIIAAITECAKRVPILDADGFGVATFNEQNGEKETCVVLLVSGDEVATAKRELCQDIESIMHDAYGMPEQHQPWIPHVTLAYSDDTSLASAVSDREGPIRFDHVRIAFGEEVTDIPLYDGTALSDTAEAEPVDEYDTVTAAMSDDDDKEKMKKSSPSYGVDTTLAGGKESDVNRKGGSHNLLHYWTRGPGAAEIGWGTDGSMKRCIALLGAKGVKSPGGLCAEYHKAATGQWPTEGGKHGIPSAVEIEALEAELVTGMVAAGDTLDIDAELGEYDGGWIGPLMVEDTDTGDQRMFSGGSITWEDPSEIIHPFQWAQSNLGEHKGSVTAGRIDQIWRDPQNPRIIMGKGRFNLGDPDGLRAFRQVRDGFAGGVSIDPDQVTDADVELEFATGEDGADPFVKPTKTIFHAGRLRGATLVAFPALVEAAIRLTKKGETSAVVASVTDDPWEGLQHELRLGDGDIDGLVASAAFAYVHDIDDFVSRQQCRFLHHEIDDDGRPGRASLVACARYIEGINAGRTYGLTYDQLHQAYRHMARHFHDAGRSAPAFTLSTPDAVVASVPQAAPLEWFGNPKLSGPTPITVTNDGRVFGHAAAWNSCHTGFSDTCVSPPVESDYGYFTTGEVLTAEGHRVAVGQITLGTSHAPTRGLSVSKAIDHYGDTGTAVADVTAGTDEHGIWVAGAVRPGVDAEQLHALRASALSGDWRRIGGSLRMVALLAVNVPGFPIPRTGTALAAGKQVSLVASGIIDRTTLSFEDEIALLAGSCGIPAADMKPREKHMKMEDELIALASELGLED